MVGGSWVEEVGCFDDERAGQCWDCDVDVVFGSEVEGGGHGKFEGSGAAGDRDAGSAGCYFEFGVGGAVWAEDVDEDAVVASVGAVGGVGAGERFCWLESDFLELVGDLGDESGAGEDVGDDVDVFGGAGSAVGVVFGEGGENHEAADEAPAVWDGSGEESDVAQDRVVPLLDSAFEVDFTHR